MGSLTVMTPELRNFVAELHTLCLKHKVELSGDSEDYYPSFDLSIKDAKDYVRCYDCGKIIIASDVIHKLKIRG